MVKITQDNMAVLGQIKDLASQCDRGTDPFLFYLPQFLEHGVLNTASYTSFLTFTENATRIEQNSLVTSALKVLNQIVDQEDGYFIQPTPYMFMDNHDFHWAELGGHIDPESVITHIVNRCALVLNLGKK